MYVLPVETDFGMEEILAHQILNERKMLQVWSEEMIGRIIFVSASWLCVAEKPVYYLVLFWFAEILGFIEKTFFKSDKNSKE